MVKCHLVKMMIFSKLLYLQTILILLKHKGTSHLSPKANTMCSKAYNGIYSLNIRGYNQTYLFGHVLYWIRNTDHFSHRSLKGSLAVPWGLAFCLHPKFPKLPHVMHPLFYQNTQWSLGKR